MNHETPEQAINQWLKENEKGIAHEHESAIAIHAFKAGASWREQQAASGFSEWWDGYIHADTFTHTAKDAWQAAQLSSAKLLAEKDAEIERLKLARCSNCNNKKSNHVKGCHNE